MRFYAVFVALYRIGTAARLSGLEVATIRNWEQRYGVVAAERSAGRQRLYTLEEIERLRALKELVDRGFSAGEAHNVLRQQLKSHAHMTGQRIRGEAQRLRAAAAATRERAEAERRRAAAAVARSSANIGGPAMPTIVVPFRGAQGKERLGALPRAVREALSLAMFEDVVAACTPIGNTIVVTSDARGRTVAARSGAYVREDIGGGQGAAVAAALAELDGPVLVVNSDLPSIRRDDVEALWARTPDRGLALAVAADGTTNAIGLSAARLFAPLYGPGSAERFREHARSLGVEVVTAAIPALAQDVDSLDDLEMLHGRAGAHTRAVKIPQPA